MCKEYLYKCNAPSFERLQYIKEVNLRTIGSSFYFLIQHNVEEDYGFKTNLINLTSFNFQFLSYCNSDANKIIRNDK
jgi:hypothetical protein